MNKLEKKQIDMTIQAQKIMGDAWAGYAARSLSGLIRSTMGKNTRKEALELAFKLGVASHPDFII